MSTTIRNKLRRYKRRYWQLWSNCWFWALWKYHVHGWPLVKHKTEYGKLWRWAHYDAVDPSDGRVWTFYPTGGKILRWLPPVLFPGKPRPTGDYLARLNTLRET